MSCGSETRKLGLRHQPFVPKKGEVLITLLESGKSLDEARKEFSDLDDATFQLLVEMARAFKPLLFPISFDQS
jgi:hypothetical protein